MRPQLVMTNTQDEKIKKDSRFYCQLTEKIDTSRAICVSSYCSNMGEDLLKLKPFTTMYAHHLGNQYRQFLIRFLDSLLNPCNNFDPQKQKHGPDYNILRKWKLHTFISYACNFTFEALLFPNVKSKSTRLVKTAHFETPLFLHTAGFAFFVSVRRVETKVVGQAPHQLNDTHNLLNSDKPTQMTTCRENMDG